MVCRIGTTAGPRGVRYSPVRVLARSSAAITALAVAVATAACVRGSAPEQDEVVLSVGYAAGVDRRAEVIAVLTGEGLFRTASDGRLEPVLATSSTIAHDGKTILVNLRQDVFFHDGSPMTATDVKASLDRVRGDPRRPLLGDIESIETRGPHQLSIRLARPSAQLVLFELGVRIYKRLDGDRTVGTGPFQVDAGQEDTTIRVNPYYHSGVSKIDVVHLESYPTVRMAWAAMMRSEIDFLHEVPIASRDFVDADSSVRVFSHESDQAISLVFNTRRPPFDDPRLRVALSHAVDRDAIVDGAFRGHASVASEIWTEHWVYGDINQSYGHDPRRADRLLTELGFAGPAARNPAGEPPNRLRFRCLVGVDLAQHERTALLLQRQLRQLGVEMAIDAMPFEEMARQAVTRPDSWDAVLLPINTARNLTRLYTYWHSSQQLAVSGFTGADEALEVLRSSVTADDARIAATEVQRILFEQAPAIFLAVADGARAVSRRFVVPDEPGRDVVETLWQWRVATDTSGN